nr:MAG TPA: hypothetical protein [Caudoviricetes sp.]
MFINKNSLIVNGINMGKYIVDAKYGYNKLWSSNSGRNLAGTQSGTLVGIFPKIVVTFRKLTKDELEEIVPILDSATQNVTYYDPNKKENVTMSTYTGDYEITNKFIIKEHKNESFTISFIARQRRQ